MSRATEDNPGALAQGKAPGQLRSHLRLINIAMVFGCGWAGLVIGVSMTLYGREMGLAGWHWGVFSAIPYLGTLCQFLGSYWVERTRRRKVLFIVALMFERLVWVPIAFLPWLISDRGGLVAVGAVFMLYLMQAAMGSMGMPAWTSWMADVVPTRMRGRFFGFRNRLGWLVQLPVALFAGWLLLASSRGALILPHWVDWHTIEWTRHPFAWTRLEVLRVFFAVGAVLGLIDIAMFFGIPDRRNPHHRPPRLRQIFGPPLRNRAFLRYLLFFATFALAGPGINNYWQLHLLNNLRITEMWAQAVTVAMRGLAAIAMLRLWGRVVDMFGRKTVWLIACAFPVVLPLCWIPVGPGVWQVALPLAFLSGMAWNGIELANHNTMLMLAEGKEGSSSYQAVFAAVMSLSGVLSGLIFSGLGSDTMAAWIGRLDLRIGGSAVRPIHAMFLVQSLIFGAAYFLLLPRVPDEGRLPAPAAIRYMLAGLFGPAGGRKRRAARR